MKIEILGDGCSKCREMLEHVHQALEETGIEADVRSINDPQRLAELGVRTLPGLTIDGELKSTGKILGLDDVKKLLRS